MGEIADDLIDQGYDTYYGGYDEDGDDFGHYRPRVQLKAMWLSGQHTGVATEKAVLWELVDQRREWFPRTQIIEIQRHQMLISGWIAKAKGLSTRDNIQPVSEAPPVQSVDEYGYPDYVYDP